MDGALDARSRAGWDRCTNTSTTCAPGAHAPSRPGPPSTAPSSRSTTPRHPRHRVRRGPVRRRLPPRQRLRARSGPRPTGPGSGPFRFVSTVLASSVRPLSRATTPAAGPAPMSPRRPPSPSSPRTSGTARTSRRSAPSTPAGTSRPRRPRRSPSTTRLPRRRPRPLRSSRPLPVPAATISWTEPPGQVSPVTHAHITVCKATVCRTSTQPAGLGSGQAIVALPDGPGAYAVSVSLSDAAGNHDPYRAAHWSITLAGSLATVTRSTPPTPSTPTSAGLRLATPHRRQGPSHDPGPRDDGPEHARPCPSHAQGPDRRPRPHDHEAGDGHEPPLHRHAQAPVTPLADGDPHGPPRHHDDHADDSQPLSDSDMASSTPCPSTTTAAPTATSATTSWSVERRTS